MFTSNTKVNSVYFYCTDSENFSYSWVELENTASAVTHRETAHGKRPPALSLAQEFELLAPEEFAQTGEGIHILIATWLSFPVFNNACLEHLPMQKCSRYWSSGMKQYMKSQCHFLSVIFICVINLHGREKLVADKQKMHTDLEAFRKYSIILEYNSFVHYFP